MDCSICLQNFVHPVKLPCGHIFCFLCIKGCAFHRRRCPICRGRVSLQFFENPQLLSVSELPSTAVKNSPEQSVTSDPIQPVVGNFRWFYEGYAGWWQYDERTSDELEEAHKNELSSVEVSIAGFIYTINLVEMFQMRKDGVGRRRRIKRDLDTCDKKGIAGIKLTSLTQPRALESNPHSSDDQDDVGVSHQLDTPPVDHASLSIAAVSLDDSPERADTQQSSSPVSSTTVRRSNRQAAVRNVSSTASSSRSVSRSTSGRNRRD